MVEASDQLLTFRVDDRHFTVPTAAVAEVARLPAMSRVPHAPPGLLGLANVRGSVVPVLSVARLLLEKDTAPTRLLVMNGAEPVALAVDEVSRLDNVDSADRIDVAELIGRCMPARARGQVSRSVAVMEAEATVETVQLLTFRIGNQDFALPLASVDEVLRIPAEISIMPHADEVVVGSTAFRNSTLPLLSLSALLALPRRANDSRSRVIAVGIGNHRVGLVVDAMGDILRMEPDDIDPVPHVLSRGNAEARIQAICRVEGGSRLVSVLSTEHLLRDDITQRLLHRGSGDLETMEQSQAEQGEQFLIFRIGDDEFGVPVEAVEEIAPLPAMLTALPKAPAFIKGVMNLRGEVIPVIDQAHRFNGAAAKGARRRVVVLRIGGLRAGFIVDSVSEVLRVASSALREAPDMGAEGTRVFERVANLPHAGKLMLIVSPRELLDRAEQDLLRALGEKDASAQS